MSIRRNRAGFTILELVVAMLVLSIILGSTMIVLLRVQQQYTAQRKATEARDQLRALELTMARLFRTARANPRNMPTASVAMAINYLGRTGTSWNNVELKADYNPVDAALTGAGENVRVELTNDTVFVRWTKSVAPEPIAYPVKELRFQFYALDGTELTDVTAASTNARRVKVSVGVPAGESSAILRRATWVSLRN